MNNSLKTNMAFARFLGINTTYYQVDKKEQIIEFLNSKIKSTEEDPNKKSITTWNDYLGDIKYFFRWIYNKKKKDEGSGEKEVAWSDWETPPFARIKKKKTKRLSPYLESEL